MVAASIVGGWTKIKNSLKFNKEILSLYIVAPCICFLAFLIYFSIIYLIGSFTYGYLERLFSRNSTDTPLFIVYTFFNAYVAAISLNALYALGEEARWVSFKKNLNP